MEIGLKQGQMEMTDKNKSSLFHPQNLDYPNLAEETLKKHPILRKRIEENCSIEPQTVVIALAETMRFLSLVAFSEKKLTPGQKIDNVWHEFILCTKAYLHFCEGVFGRFIHHSPGGTMEENQSQYRMTWKLYQIYFGTPLDSEFWEVGHFDKVESNCGPCESM